MDCLWIEFIPQQNTLMIMIVFGQQSCTCVNIQWYILVAHYDFWQRFKYIIWSHSVSVCSCDSYPDQCKEVTFLCLCLTDCFSVFHLFALCDFSSMYHVNISGRHHLFSRYHPLTHYSLSLSITKDVIFSFLYWHIPIGYPCTVFCVVGIILFFFVVVVNIANKSVICYCDTITKGTISVRGHTN